MASRASGNGEDRAALPFSSVGGLQLGHAYRGAPELKPDQVWDDGRTTFLRFNGNRRIPNVYGYLPDGTETTGSASLPSPTPPAPRCGSGRRIAAVPAGR